MKTTLNLLLAAAFIAFLGSVAEAVPVTYSETFLGGKNDGAFMDVQQGWSASFGFNFTGPGDTVRLTNSNQQLVNSWSPSTDASGFSTAGNYTIQNALLNFTFSSGDADRERVTIRAGIYDGNTILSQKTYTLGTDSIRGNYVFRSRGGMDWDRQTRDYANFSLDLLELGLGTSLADGKFMTLVLATDYGCNNDFRIDQANLQLTADSSTAPVPEPGTVLLLGGGLLGLVLSRKLFRRA